MNKRCLLLRLPDRREVFTHEKHHNALLEFSRAFGAKILTVDADAPLLQPHQIAEVFCNPSQPSIKYHYRVIKPGTAVGARHQMLKKVSDVRSYIESQFKDGQTVRIKELHHRFQKHNIAVSTLYRHVSYVKDRLDDQGEKVIKVSTGCYRLA